MYVDLLVCVEAALLCIISLLTVTAFPTLEQAKHASLRRELAKGGNAQPNSGQSNYNMAYDISSIVDAEECFDPTAWCETDLVDILTDTLKEEDLDQDEFMLLINGLQAYFCDGATSAFANTTAFVHGSGEFTVTRSGNNGAVKKIELEAALDTSVLALTHVEINATADESASARAYAYRAVGSTGYNSCGTRYAPGSLRYWLCATARGDASSSAIAFATATGSASAASGTDQSTDLSVFVEAANIEEFDATITTSATSFAAAEASAAAKVYTSAFSRALVDVRATATIQDRRYTSCLTQRRYTDCHRHCSLCGVHCHSWYACQPGYYGDWRTISSSNFGQYVNEIQSQVEQSFASTFASSLAAIHVKMTIPAYFKNENGVEDTFMFPEGEEEIPVEVTTQCFATTV